MRFGAHAIGIVLDNCLSRKRLLSAGVGGFSEGCRAYYARHRLFGGPVRIAKCQLPVFAIELGNSAPGMPEQEIPKAFCSGVDEWSPQRCLRPPRAHEYPNIWPRSLFAADGELRKNAAIVICPRDAGPRGWGACFNCSRVGRSAFFFGIVGIAQAAHIGRLRAQYVIIVKPKSTEKSAFSTTENKACERHLITVAIHSRRQ